MGDAALWTVVSVTGALVTWVALAYGQGLASRRADRLRRYDNRAADVLDQMRFSQSNPAALPMYNRDFDRPR